MGKKETKLYAGTNAVIIVIFIIGNYVALLVGVDKKTLLSTLPATVASLIGVLISLNLSLEAKIAEKYPKIRAEKGVKNANKIHLKIHVTNKTYNNFELKDIILSRYTTKFLNHNETHVGMGQAASVSVEFSKPESSRQENDAENNVNRYLLARVVYSLVGNRENIAFDLPFKNPNYENKNHRIKISRG